MTNRTGLPVVLLCGGTGTRLREETEYRPKPMVEIGDRPILWHIMKGYAEYGHTDFIVCLGYKGERIREYFLRYDEMQHDLTVELGGASTRTVRSYGDHQELGWRVTLANTGLKTMTGARIKRASRYIEGDTFLVTYGDGVADVDLDALVAFHRGGSDKHPGDPVTFHLIDPDRSMRELAVRIRGPVWTVVDLQSIINHVLLMLGVEITVRDAKKK